MTPQGRSALSAACIVAAAVSVIAALITAIFAVTASSHVSDKLEPKAEQGYYHITPGYEPFDPSTDSACAYQSEDDPPSQGFWTCQQKESGAWSAQVAARQANTQARGDVATILGLMGLTFAICAVALNGSARSAPQTTASERPAPN